MRYPEDVEIWEHSPGRRLVEVVIQVKNTTGTMAECRKAVSEMGVNMLTGYQTAPGTSPVARWSFFADMTDSKVGLAEFGNRLRGLARARRESSTKTASSSRPTSGASCRESSGCPSK